MERLYTTDFIKITYIFRDTKTGRFLSQQQADRLKLKDPARVKRETRLILKKKPKGLKIKAKPGKQITKKDFQKIVNFVKRHNLALTLSKKWGITYQEALRRIKRAEDLYRRGLISAGEFKTYVGS